MSQQAVIKRSVSHNGLLSIVCMVLVKVLIMTLLAWFLLTSWFIAEMFVKGQAAVMTGINHIITLNIDYIGHNPSSYMYWLGSWFAYAHEQLAYVALSVRKIGHQFLQMSVQLVLSVIEINLSRLVIFLAALPLFLLFMLIFGTDGLVKRDIRKFQGARESTLFFHRTKHLIGFLFYGIYLIFMCMPVALPPFMFVAALVLLVGIATQQATTYFKKYL